jgi:hypothetical protein
MSLETPSPSTSEEMERNEALENKESNTALEKAVEGFESFGSLFSPPKKIEGQDQDTRQKFQKALTTFLGDRVKEASTALDQPATKTQAQRALESLDVLAETLGDLPQSIDEVQQRADRTVHYKKATDRGASHIEEFRGISFVISPPKGSALLEEPIQSIRLDVVLERAGHTPQQIRVNFYGGQENEEYELSSLRFDVHHFAEGNRLQIDLEGRALELVTRKHHDLPHELDQEAFTELQHLLIFNLCPPEEYAKKEYYLKQLLKAMGMQGKKAKKRQELIDEIMTGYPGTPQYERQQAENRMEKEKEDRREKDQERRRRQLELIAGCERGLEEIIAKIPVLKKWAEEQRQEQTLPPKTPDSRVVFGFILGVKPEELVAAAEERPFTTETEMLLREIPEILCQAIEKRRELAQLKPKKKSQPEIEALEYSRDLAKEITPRHNREL